MADIHRCKLEVELKPATHHDLAAMVDVHTQAFAHDQFSNFMLHGRPPGTHQAMMQEAIEFWMGETNTKMVTATDTSGKILGWLCMTVKQRHDAVPISLDRNDRTLPATDLASNAISSGLEARKRLGASMRQDLLLAETQHMVEDTYIVLQALVTHLAWQRCGIGSRLVQWAIENADAQHLPCWVHASQAAYPLYIGSRFIEMQRNEYDLNGWASAEHKAAGHAWGLYTFCCMKRPATVGTA